MNKGFIHELGSHAKDSLTGFEGIISYRCEFLTGCNQYGLQPKDLDKDGNVKPEKQFDENRIVILKKPAYKLPEPPKPIAKPGGPNTHVTSRSKINK